MPSSLKQKLFYGLHQSKKSETNISAPQPISPEKAGENTGSRKSAEGGPFIPSPNGKWQNVQKQPDTAGHRNLPEALRYLTLNDERLRTSTIDRSDPELATAEHRRQESGNTLHSEQSQRPSSDSSRSRGVLVGPVQDPYAEGYANKNISRDEAILAGDLNDSRAIRAALEKERHNVQSGHRRSESSEVKRSRRHAPIVEPDEDLYSGDVTIPAKAVPARSSSLQKSAEPAWPLSGGNDDASQIEAASRSSPIQKTSLQPVIPETTVSSHSRNSSRPNHGHRYKTSSADSQSENPNYPVYNSSSPVSLDGVVDLTNTEDTRQYTSYTPAVTHNTTIVNTHEILHQPITREIHNHDVFHRVLPILQVEVLPPRHYVPHPSLPGSLLEISPKQILGGEEAHWKMQKVMQEALDNNLSLQNSSKERFTGRRPFTARRFDGSEGDFKALRDEDGFAYTEQTWVHFPTLQNGGMETGQTEALHFDQKGSMSEFDFGLGNRNRDSYVHSERIQDGEGFEWI
ncbi:uncharacterized protein MYCFIDRAFT_195189 [Pseudocercospora fijiensis CIRAD86]|uniref:Uncharacterized protein n=1 Tax=Pseudocercospora fijiensis (strain CIRAD86) TaxID=383855 RepID=M3B3R8_PSEFD|nr:uncharacterized protein MYCFIDRAFT_195189 [Pseudocercospora fijiensis CIRAD86]EME84017.1 hypothetical protein MYCFIDRAFT_195189 [Pseudocercospora fijiensis CIRAD86]